MLRLMLAITIVLLPNLLYLPGTGVPGLNSANILLLVLLTVLAFSRPFQGPQMERGILTAPLLFWFFALTVSMLIAWVRMPINAMDDIVHLKNIIFYPLLYFVFRNCRQDMKGTRMLIYLVLVVAVIAGIDAAKDGLTFDITSYSEEQRTAGPFGEINASNRAGVFYASFLPMLAAIVLFLRGHVAWRIAAGIGVAILLFAIMVTFSRQSYLIALIVLTMLVLRRHTALAVLVIALAIPAFQFLPPSVVDRVASTQQYDAVGSAQLDSSTESRFKLWAGAWKMWKDHPAGIGLKRFPATIGDYSEYENKDAHSAYVLTLAEMGVLGIVALLWLLWRLLRLAFSVRASGDDPIGETRTLGTGFIVAVIAMSLGNVYGSPFLDGLVMGNFWVLCGLLERYAMLRRHASPAVVGPSVDEWIGARFPLAGRVLPGRFQHTSSP
ncbi:MAG TPA: O-antigen ligase family protein [Lysobacter sp.]|nr:O-antigen ligase family protein [Lysobacter sp.]